MRKAVSSWPWICAAASGAILSLGYPGWNVDAVAWFWMMPLLAAIWYGRDPADKPLDLPDVSTRRGHWLIYPFSIASRWIFSLGHRIHLRWPRAWRGFWLGYLAGLVFFLINLRWISELTLEGAIFLPMYLALYPGIWGAFCATIGRLDDSKLVPPPKGADAGSATPASAGTVRASLHTLKVAFLNAAAWCGLEWLRGVAFTGFGWNGLGVALHQRPMLIQFSDIVGVTGLSFLLLFAGTVGFVTVRRIHLEVRCQRLRPHIDFGVTMLGVVFVFLYGINANTSVPEDEEVVEVSVLLVQLAHWFEEKSDASSTRDIAREYYRTTKEAYLTPGPDILPHLVVWPETAVPGYADNLVNLYDPVLDLGIFSLITGSETQFIDDAIMPAGEYNSVVLMRDQYDSDSTQFYHKMHLVPFGEYIPARDWFPPFEWVAGSRVVYDFKAGTEAEPLKLEYPPGDIQIIPLVCFEDTLGNLARQFVRGPDQPQMIVNVTNAAWFNKSIAAEHHLANAKFRCIELRRPMVRAANTGVTCIIDETGSLYDRSADPKNPVQRRIGVEGEESTFAKETLRGIVRVPKNPQTTVYAVVGDLFSQLMLAVAGVAVLLNYLRR